MGKGNYYMSDEEYLLITQKTPIPTVNLVILDRSRNPWQVLLLVRKTGYAKGSWCIIGGRIRIDESLSKALKRQVEDLKVKVRIVPPFNPNFPSFIDDRKKQDETKSPRAFKKPVLQAFIMPCPNLLFISLILLNFFLSFFTTGMVSSSSK